MRYQIPALVVSLVQLHLSMIGAEETGLKLPPLHVTDWIQGESREVGEWGDGKVYILELWGTWCQPCIPAIPKLSAIQERYRERGLVVIGYSWEEPEHLRSFVRKMGNKMTYVVVTDTDEQLIGELSKTGSVQGFPYAYLIDEKGLVAWQGHPKNLSEVVEAFYEDR